MENEGKKDKLLKIALLAVAAALVIGAALLSSSLKGQTPYANVAQALRENGYTLNDEDLYHVGTFENASISGVLSGVDMTEAVEASKAAGFSGDVEATGKITALLLNTQGGDILTIYTRDGEIELCFVQRLDGGGITPIQRGGE